MSVKEYKCGKGIDFKYAKGEVDILGNTFHSHYELFFLLDGAVELTNNHARVTLTPYQLVIIPPGQYHQFVVKDNIEKYERCVLNLDADFMDGDFLTTALCGKELLTLSSGERIVENFLYLKSVISYASDDDISHLLPAVATDIIFSIKHHAPHTATGGINALSRAVMEHLNAYFSDPIDLSGLAGTFHVSVSSLCHTFKKDFGLTIKQYIIQKRLNTAKLYIKKGMGAEEACTECGFSNYSAFFRAYKKLFGCAPSKSEKTE